MCISDVFRRAALLALCLLALISVPALADDIRLAPGDIIGVTVLDHPDFGSTTQIMADGTVILPVVGQVKLAGLTLQQGILKLKSKDGYGKLLLDPEVTLSLNAAHQENVYISGTAMRLQGSYQLRPGMGAYELVLAATGLMADVSECYAYLIRGENRERVELNLNDLMSGRPGANPLLKDRDAVIVNLKPKIIVSVAGEVATSGTFELLQETATVTKALAAARGLHGDPKGLLMKLSRGTTVLPIDLVALYQPNSTADIPLHNGDVLTVESAFITVHLAGDVTKPGDFSLRRDSTLRDLIAQAGGVTRSAKLTGVTVLHADNTQEFGALDPTGANPRLRADDRVTVPTLLVNVDVKGRVIAQGTYKFLPNVPIAEVITQAGGLADEAMLSAVQIKRATGVVETLDATKDGVMVALAEGDTVLVPQIQTSITVTGLVVKGGEYKLDPGKPLTVSQAIARAGGLTDKSDPGKVTVVRLVDGKELKIRVPLDRSLHAKKPQDDIALLPNDKITVPEAKKFGIDDVMRWVTLGAIAGVL